MNFKEVEKAFIDLALVINNSRAKKDGRYKEAKLKFVKYLRTYLNEVVKNEVEKQLQDKSLGYDE